MRIVFMGTPQFAVAILDAIHQAGYDIAAVVTASDKPAGRGKKMQMSEVKHYALAHNLPVLQPEKLKNPEFIASLKSLNADLFVVVAFRMLPEEVFLIPPKGTFNVHASLLPQYRGAAPIHHAVMNGEKKSGVTTFFLNKEIDKGNIIDCEEVEIENEETTGELYEKLMYRGAALAVKTIQSIEKGDVTTKSQANFDEKELKPAPKIFKEDTLIRWEDTAQNIFNKIRGLSPFPCAYTRIQNVKGETEILKCYFASVSEKMSTGKAGEFHTDGKTFFAVNTLDFQILFKDIQIQGKKRMEIGLFLSGFRGNNYKNQLF